MPDFTQQERRILNEAIESTYLEVAGLASSIEIHYRRGLGNVLDLYEKFYFHMSLLRRITSNREEMASATTEIKALKDWLDLPYPGDKGLQQCLMDGIKVFDNYDIALNQCGLIALPHKGR